MSFQQQFEAACANLLSEHESNRQAASEFITQFRDSPRPFDACFALIDASSGCSDLARSTAAVVCRQALVRAWSSLSRDEIVDIRVKLLNRVVLDTTSHSVRSQLIDAVALLVKRSWIELDELKNDIFDIVGQLVANDNAQFVFRRIAIELLTALVNHFGIRPSSASGAHAASESNKMNQSVEFHNIVRLSFEHERLFGVLVTALNELRYAVGMYEQQQASTECATLIGQCLDLLSSIFDWPFAESLDERNNNNKSSNNNSSSGSSSSSSRDSDTIRVVGLPVTWREPFLNQVDELVDYFFTMYERFSTSNVNMAHKIRNVLEKFCRLGGDALDESNRRKLLHALLPRLTS